MNKYLLHQHLIRLLVILIVFFGASVIAQPVVQRDKNFGNAGLNQDGFEMSSVYRKTLDGNFIVVCTATYQNGEDKTQLGEGDSDVWIVKFRPDGSKIWDRTLIALSYSGGPTDIQPTKDGGYIVCSSSSADKAFDKSENSRGQFDYWVVKLNAAGGIEWDKTLGGDQIDAPEAILQTADGGYMVAGRSESGVNGEKTSAAKGGEDYWVVKLSSTGVKEWDAGFGGSSDDVLLTAQQASDGGYLVGGYSASVSGGDKSDAKGSYDYWVVKMSPSGKMEWEKSFGGDKAEYLYHIYPETDGGFILAGGSGSNAGEGKTEDSRGGIDGWLVKIDSLGEKVWDKTLGGSDYDDIKYVEPTLDGGYLLCAYSKSEISGDKTDSLRNHADSDAVGDYWLIKLSAAHETLWDKTIGGDGNDYPAFATETATGKYFIGGESSSSIYYMPADRSVQRKGQKDLWFASLSEEPLPVTLTSFTSQKEKSTALLSWSTSSETHCDRFEVQRSLNGKSWDMITSVKSNGHTNQAANYFYVDNQPVPGSENLYRLKMIDLDGTFTYSKIVSLHFDSEFTLNLFPNPAAETLTIQLAEWKNVKSLELLNRRSTVVYHSEGKPAQTINIKALPSGMYFVRIILADGSAIVRKLIVGK